MRIAANLIILLAWLPAMSSLSADRFSTNEYVVAQEQTVGDEQWVLANRVDAAGTFQDDLFLSSNSSISLSGSFAGNVWAAAMTDAELAGSFQRNVRLVGQNIRIDGTIDGNLIAYAINSIIIGTNAAIRGNVELVCVNSIVQEGHIGGDAELSSMKLVTMDGSVSGSTRITSPEIILSDAARVGGDLHYLANKELVLAEGVVEGSISRIPAENPVSTNRLLSHAIWFLAALLTGIPFISLFPMTAAMSSMMARKSPLKCLLVGVVATLFIPFFAMTAMSAGIGIPLGMILFASWGILVYISRIVSGIVIGTLILRRGNASHIHIVLSMATGLGLIYILTFVPSFLGLFVQATAICLGMGALLLALLQKRKLILQVPQELLQLDALRKENQKSKEESPS